jgi:hypothetical protein
MNTIQMVVHVCKAAPGISDLRHDYRARATRSEPETEFAGSRVHEVAGDFRGVGVIIQQPGFERMMMAALCGTRQISSSSKPLRQVILSVPEMPDASPKDYQQVLSTLMQAAKKWIDTFAPGVRWLAFAHKDRYHPHVHLVLENTDYKHGTRRLDINPAMLRTMQKMEWCADLGIVPGKGSMKSVIAGKKLAESGVDFATAASWQQRVQLGKWYAFSARENVAQHLLLWCAERKTPQSLSSLVDALRSEPLPPGWSLKSKTKAGGDLIEPSIKIGGKTLRLSTFLEMFAPVGDRSKKDLEKQQKEVGAGDMAAAESGSNHPNESARHVEINAPPSNKTDPNTEPKIGQPR